MKEKYCSKCGILKDAINDFYAKNGQCKDCRKKLQKEKKDRKIIETKNEMEELKKILKELAIDIKSIKNYVNMMKKSINRNHQIVE